MVVSEGAISNIMGGMENTAGVRLHSHRHKLKQRFDIIRKLGQGTYGKVQLAVNKDTGQEVAIKTIKKAKIETEQDLVRIRREIQIMSSVQHPQIIHIYEVFENREKMVLVMEYAAGGELYDYLSERKVLSVDEARRVFRQVSSAVYYCHKHKICHRDLKLENILLDIDGNAKIADFGLSNVFDEKRRLDTFCGSPLYASPEIVKGVPYVGPEVDCWSLGVLLYTLVYGAMPFDGSNFRRLVKQITQGDFYEPPTPSTASQLVRAMLTVGAEKRANIADICNHWWVNDGEATSCLDEAETLANQTPVRLDLLLSLAPKAISSEHMLIQPDEEDASHRSDEGQSAAPQIQLPPPPPVPPPPNGPQATRSLSLGAMASSAPREIEFVAPVPAEGDSSTGAVPRRDDEKRRRDSEARTAETTKKMKEATDSRSSVKPLDTETPGKVKPQQQDGVIEEKKKMKKKSSGEDLTGTTEKEKTDKKKSTKKKQVTSEGSPMDTDDKEPKKSMKGREASVENDGSEIGKPDKRKSIRNRDSTSASKEVEKKRTTSKKEEEKTEAAKSSVVSMEMSPEVTSRDSTPKATSPQPESNQTNKKTNRTNSITTNTSDSRASSSIRSPSNKSVISAISTDGTLKASDSSISTRHSPSPPKSTVETSTAATANHVESKPPTKQPLTSSASKSSQSDKLAKVSSAAKVPRTNSANKVYKASSGAKATKAAADGKVDPIAVNGSPNDSTVPADTETILKETASKIKDESLPTKPEIAEIETTTATSPVKRKGSDALNPPTDSTSSKDSSVVSTPARSRTGSESSNDAKSGRQDSRRGSKIFSKAAMWDNMCSQQQNEKPPPAADKARKNSRSGGLNLTDITKKFEEKPPADRKKPVVGSFKISDVKKSFENKSGDKVGGFRRTSTDSSVDSLPLSPSRSMKKEASLPPPAKPASKKVDVPVVKEKEIPIKKETSPPKDEKPVETSESKSNVAKEKSPVKSKVTAKSTVSPTKEIGKKEKSPVKEPLPKREVPIKRDVTTPKRTSPVKDKPKAVTIAIKKTGTSHRETPPPKRDVETPDLERPRPADRKVKSTSSSNRVASPKFESSESSDSESEAERLLRQLSERRERIEAAKKEKLRKVSQQQDEARDTSSSSGHEKISRPCHGATKSGLPPLETPSDTPDDMIPVKPTSIPKASMIKDAEQPPGAKFASLPRGFKSRGSEKSTKPQIQGALPPLVKEITAIPPEEVIAPSPRDMEYDGQRRKKSEVEIMLTPSSQNILQQQQQRGVGGGALRDQDPSKRASYAEIQLAAPTGQQEHPHTPPHSTTAGDGMLQRAPRERIIPIMIEDQEEEDDRSANSEDRDRWERSSNPSSISLTRGVGGEPFLHGPLFKPAPRPGHMSPHLGGVFGGPSLGLSSSRGSVASSTGSSFDQHRLAGTAPTASPEQIRKSRRERIIPISFEGGDDGGGSGNLLTPNTLDLNRPPSYQHHHHTNNSSSSSSHGMGRRLPIERPESLSSNDDDDDEEEEEDEDDGFQILTAESLFSTLLNRVRNLTRKMSQEESRSRRMPLLHHGLGMGPGASQLGFHHHSSPFGSSGSGMSTPLRQNSSTFAGGAGPASAGVPTADNGGFWSSLYSPPRELSRQNSEISSDGRGGERGSSGGVEARIPISRETSHDTALHHGEQGTPFNTLPRGWRTRLAGDDGRGTPTPPGGTDPSGAGGGAAAGGGGSSGEASGRAGGITEQRKDKNVCAARLASSSDSLVSSVSGKRQASVEGVSLPSSSVLAPSLLPSKAPSGAGYKAFASAKNIPSSVSSSNALSVPKRSSSTSGGSDAKVQLQKLVEELETSPEKQNSSTQLNVNPVFSTQSSTALSSSLKMTPASLLSKPKSATSVPSTVATVSTSPAKMNVKSTKIEPIKTSSTLPSTSAASKVISQQISNQLPESVAKLNSTSENNLKISQGSLPDKNSTKIEKSSNSTSTIGSSGKKHSDIPVTVLALSPIESIMTQSLPPEKASALLGTAKMNRSSVCIDNNIIQQTNGVHDSSKSPNDTANQASRLSGSASRTLTNGTSNMIPVSNCVSTSSLLKTSDSNSSLRGSRTSLLIEPHKKLFPWDSSTQAISMNPPSSTLNRQKSSLSATPYKRGRSEDLRPSIDSIGKIDSSFERYKKAVVATASPVENTIKPYRGSRSRELNPTIEAASEKLSQLNSSNLKKISPFEAYRRSKSRDLGASIELLQKQNTQATPPKPVSLSGMETKSRMTSPPPPGLPQSPTSIARLASPPPPSTSPKSLAPSPPTSLPIKPISVQRPLSPQDDKSPQSPFVKQSFSPEPQRSTTSSPALALNKPANFSGPVNSLPTSPEPPSSLRNSPIIAPNEITSAVQNNAVTVQRSKTPFERAKTKLERKIDRAKSPTFFVEHPKVSQDGSLDIATQNMLQNEINSGVVYDNIEAEKTKEKEAVKKTSAGENDRPKSMYKMLTSKFNKSSNNVRDETNDQVEANADEKFKLKRPSIFLKGKTENSSSRTSIAADVELQSEQQEKKPSRKLSDALNKFLGRKTDDSSKIIPSQEDCRPSMLPTAATSDLAKSERDISKKPSRYRTKVFSKSHENLNKYNEQGDIIGNRASSVAPEDNCTIESVTKSLCDHLTQLENDITNRIGSMDSSSDLRSSKNNLGVKQSRSLAPATSAQTLNSYGYSPALATRRQSQAVVTDSTTLPKKPQMSETDNQTVKNNSATLPSAKVTSTPTSMMYSTDRDIALLPSNVSSNNTQRQKPETAESVKSAPEEGRCFSPTSWAGDSVTSAPDDLQGVLSDDEDEESVMDRITRKSFYSRFQDGKRRRSRISQPATKEDEDQQLAAAKARLMGEDRRLRESLSPQRAMSPPFVSSRTSIGSSIPEWESAVARRSARRSIPRITSLPPNDYDTPGQKNSDDRSFTPSYRDGSRERGSVARAAAAGAAAGYQAASDRGSSMLRSDRGSSMLGSDRGSSTLRSERGSSMLRGSSIDPGDRGSLVLYNSVRDSSLSRLRSPSPPSKAVWSPPPHDVVVSTARDELSKRLTPLTRLASGRDSGNKVYRRTTTTGNLDLPLEKTSTTPSRPAAYRRTTTSANFDLPHETNSSTLPRPTYRRTNTMDLPVTESVINRPSDYRRLLQPSNRRYSTASNCSSYTNSTNSNNMNNNSSNHSNNGSYHTNYNNTNSSNNNGHSYNPDRGRHSYSTSSPPPTTSSDTNSTPTSSTAYWSSSYSPSMNHSNGSSMGSSSSIYTSSLSPPAATQLSSALARRSAASYSPDPCGGDTLPRSSASVYTSSYSRGDVSGTQSLPRPHSSSYKRDLPSRSSAEDRVPSSKDGHDGTSPRSMSSYTINPPYTPSSIGSSYYRREAPYTGCHTRDLSGLYSSSYSRSRALPYTGSLSTGTDTFPRRTSSTYRR